MAVEELGCAVDDHKAQVRGPAKHGAGKGVVDDRREAVLPAEARHARQVSHPGQRVGDALHIEHLRQRSAVGAARKALAECLRAWSVSPQRLRRQGARSSAAVRQSFMLSRRSTSSSGSMPTQTSCYAHHGTLIPESERWGGMVCLGVGSEGPLPLGWVLRVHSGVLDAQGWKLFVHQLMRPTIYIVLHGVLVGNPAMCLSGSCR